MTESHRPIDRAATLRRQLQLNGPITLAQYMNLAMLGSGDGYYAAGQPIGSNGDFVTAPEISQMFGELLGFWCVDTWRRMGRPDPFLLVEFGPGRGILMQDLLRAAGTQEGFAGAARLHLIEISAPLKALQRRSLDRYSPVWHEKAAALPDGPMIAIGNEFLDVFPIHQFIMTDAGWKERAIGADGDALHWTLAPPGPSLALLGKALDQAELGAVAEISPAALSFMDELARRLADQGGAGLFIDYGRVRTGFGATLQAVRRHRHCDPLTDFGEADLTAHVDFEILGRVAALAGANIAGPIEQGAFLEALGIRERAARLALSQDEATRGEIAAALTRLTDPGQMGALFKAMAVSSANLHSLAGFP